MSNRQDSTNTKLELKLQSYKQRLAQVTAEYEEKYADSRVEYTVLAEAYKAQAEELERVKEELESLQEPTDTTTNATDVSQRDGSEN